MSAPRLRPLRRAADFDPTPTEAPNERQTKHWPTSSRSPASGPRTTRASRSVRSIASIRRLTNPTTRASSSCTSIPTSASTATPASRPARWMPASPRTSCPTSGPSTSRSTRGTTRSNRRTLAVRRRPPGWSRSNQPPRFALVATGPERVDQGQAGEAGRRTVDVAHRAGVAIDLQLRPPGKMRVVVLVEDLQAQAGAEDRADHVGDRMIPLPGDVVPRLSLEVRVGSGVVEARALRVVKVVRDHAQVVVTEHPGEGVKLDQVEEPASGEERGDHGCPERQVGEPVERAEAGVDDV